MDLEISVWLTVYTLDNDVMASWNIGWALEKAFYNETRSTRLDRQNSHIVQVEWHYDTRTQFITFTESICMPPSITTVQAQDHSRSHSAKISLLW